MNLGNEVTVFSECGEGSGPTRPQSGCAAFQGGWKIIAYLKATKDLGVVFRRGGNLKLPLFADADYANRCNDIRSVSYVAVMLGNTAVSVSSTTQHCVLLFMSEAEYVAMDHGAKIA